MDYDVLNDVIAQIIDIVNNSKKEHYDQVLMENMVVSLFGYYLVFGPSIFENISKILDSLVIYRCQDKRDYDSMLESIDDENKYIKVLYDYRPVTFFGYPTLDSSKFLQYIPIIIYEQTNAHLEVIILSHELSHVLDGVNALIKKNNDEFDIDIAYSKVHADKENCYKFICLDKSFGEFAATTIENKVLEALESLDYEKINYSFIRMIGYKLCACKSNLSNGYSSSYVLFKDLVDNYKFFELMKKYYFQGYSEQDFKRAYESYGSDLSYDKLRLYISNIFSENAEYNFFRFVELIKREVDNFSNNTQFVAKKEILKLL